MSIKITVDKRTELLGILLLISDYKKNYAFLIEECGNKEYRQKIFDNFSKYQEDKSVKLLNQIFDELNFRYDAPVSLFLQLNDDFTYSKLDDYPFHTRLKSSPLVLEFLDSLPAFCDKINFEEYYNSNIEFYEKIINETKKKTNIDIVVDTLEKFYKLDIKNISFVLNLLPYTTNGNFGSNHDNIIYSNIGLKKNPKDLLTFITDNDCGSLLLHEFSHSIINPLTDKYSNIPNNAFSDIFEQMSKMAYGASAPIINEHVIRAIEVFYLKHIINTPDSITFAEMKLNRNRENGFKYIDLCLANIKYYYENIDKYENFEEFYPTLINELNNATINNQKNIIN